MALVWMEYVEAVVPGVSPEDVDYRRRRLQYRCDLVLSVASDIREAGPRPGGHGQQLYHEEQG